jgi:hypothetical protein
VELKCWFILTFLLCTVRVPLACCTSSIIIIIIIVIMITMINDQISRPLVLWLPFGSLLLLLSINFRITPPKAGPEKNPVFCLISGFLYNVYSSSLVLVCVHIRMMRVSYIRIVISISIIISIST